MYTISRLEIDCRSGRFDREDAEDLRVERMEENTGQLSWNASEEEMKTLSFKPAKLDPLLQSLNYPSSMPVFRAHVNKTPGAFTSSLCWLVFK